MAMNLRQATFDHGGQSWTRYPADLYEHFIVGCDLGASSDPTALAILHHRIEPLKTWTPRETSGRLEQDISENLDVVHLQRLALGKSYVEIVGYVNELVCRAPLPQVGVDLVIDETGVGRAVADLFDAHGMPMIKVVITAGFQAERQGGGRWSVPKHLLISGVDAALHTGSLRIAAALTDAGAMAEELKDFRRHVTSAGRASFGARVGKHDDLVLAVALAVWWSRQRRGRRMQIGHSVGHY